MAKFGRTFTVFLAAIIINSVHCLSFDLDTADYDKTIWTIGGSAVFIEHGRSLRTSFKEFLPAHFEYTKFDLTEGIWVVVPEAVPCSKSSVGSVNWDEDDMDLLHEDYADSSVNGSSETTTKATTTTTAPPTTTSIPTPACYTQASASFKCTLKSQLDSSVKVTYNIGGNAKLTIRSKSKPISISGHSRKTSGWEDADNEIDGNTMTLEAVVNGKGDYVLIDKITVRTWEPSTSSRPTSSSTTDAPTTDAPKSGQDALVPVGVSSMTFMFLFAFTVFVRDQLFSYNL